MKPTTRVNTFLKRVWAVAVLAAVAGAVVATRPARAQDGQGEATGLVAA